MKLGPVFVILDQSDKAYQIIDTAITQYGRVRETEVEKAEK